MRTFSELRKPRVLERLLTAERNRHLADRNDLDDQLFDTFSFCSELLRQKPVQAESREQLRELLKAASGGVVFTTIQKFFPDDKAAKHPLLSEMLKRVTVREMIMVSQKVFRRRHADATGWINSIWRQNLQRDERSLLWA